MPDPIREHTQYRKSSHNKILKKKKISKAKDLNWNFTKDPCLVNKHMKRCLTSFNIQEIKLKITLRHIYTPIRIKTFLSLTVLCDDQGTEQPERSFIAGGNAKSCGHCGRVGQFLMKLNIYLS